MNQIFCAFITLAASLLFAASASAQTVAPTATPTTPVAPPTNTSQQPASQQTAPALTPQDGVLLLANGQTLQGKITRAGDYYFIVVANGEIRLRTTEVELFCRTLDEVYERKRSVLMPGDAAARLDLADWCIRVGLFGNAAQQVAEARAIEPQMLRIGLVERRLDLARERSNEEPATNGLAVDPSVAGPTNEELDRFVRGLPAGVVDHFSATIQPLLLNNCTASGCHGANSTTKFSLIRVPLGRTPSRRLTQRNLFAAMQQASGTTANESPLVSAAIRPHAGNKAPLLGGRDLTQYQQLATWVQRVINGRAAPAGESSQQAKSVDNRVGLLLQSPSVPNHSPNATKIGTKPTAPSEAEKVGELAPRMSGTNTLPLTGEYVPRDPFDPELFNRRFFPATP